MKIAVVILNWNGEVLLERFLPDIVRYSQNADLYVADNASTDASVGFVTSNFPKVKIIQNPTNGGYAKGYNDALAQVDADIYCLLNSDVAVTENWLQPIIRTFEAHADIAIVQPKILDLLKKDHFEYAGAAGGFLDQLGYPFCRGRIFQTLEKDHGQYDQDRPIFWATGACMFVRKSTFDQLGGFDEDYFAHQEEVDFCWRAQNRGYGVRYVWNSKVYHLGGSTLSNMNPKKTYLNFRNSLFSIVKNLPRRKAFVIIVLRLVLDGIAGVRFLLQGRWRHMLAILRAHLAFYKRFPKMYRKREGHYQQARYHIVPSIVWSYFVKGIRYFNILVKD